MRLETIRQRLQEKRRKAKKALLSLHEGGIKKEMKATVTEALRPDPQKEELLRQERVATTRKKQNLRERLMVALDEADPEALLHIAQDDPKLVLRMLVTLQPAEITATVRHEAVALVMHPVAPPDDWTPPSLAGEALPVIDAELPDVKETPINVGENGG